jgi:hypothetical protein
MEEEEDDYEDIGDSEMEEEELEEIDLEELIKRDPNWAESVLSELEIDEISENDDD